MSLFGIFRPRRPAETNSSSPRPEQSQPTSKLAPADSSKPKTLAPRLGVNGNNERTPNRKGRRKRKAASSLDSEYTPNYHAQKRRKTHPVGVKDRQTIQVAQIARVSQNTQTAHNALLATPQHRAGMANTYTPPTTGSWFNKFRRLSTSLRADPVQVKQEENDDVEMHNILSHTPADLPIKTIEKDSEAAAAEDSITVTRRKPVTTKAISNDDDKENDDDDDEEDDEENDEEDDEEDGRDDDDSGLYIPESKSASRSRAPTDKAETSSPTPSDGPENEYDDSDDDEFNDSTNLDAVEEDWEWLFEKEPPAGDATTIATDSWPVDEDELEAYEEGVAMVAGYEDVWTADERRVHRLLALRGFHPLLPGTWTRDFLGVPMYPTLFAPLGDETQEARPTIISNYGSQFHATKALRALFDLQARVSGLRQSGHNTERIGAIIERELRRYISWALTDAGLDQCGPLAAMPNIAAKRFLVAGNDKRSKKKPLARRVQEYFGDWVARYRSYYATLPDYEVEGSNGTEMRRLRPPRLLYGFAIVQHAVMLLVVDAASPDNSGYDKITVQTPEGLVRKKRRRQPSPRCLAEFNLSLGDRWLDASLNVAIPVHVARDAQMRCKKGLVLPSTRVDAVDDDA